MITYLLCLLVALLAESAALNVNISPVKKTLVGFDKSLTVKCKADGPITHCQLRVSNRYEQKPAVDLSLGALSNVSHFTYAGDGLFAGHCGATIDPEALPDWDPGYGTVQCRVRDADSDWVYSTMSVHRSETRKIPLTIKTARLIVVPRSGNVNLLFKANETLTDCDVIHPVQLWTDLLTEPDCGFGGVNRVCYNGRGVNSNECGATIMNVDDESNGLYWFSMETSEKREYSHVQVIVTKPPSTPILTSKTTVNADGTTTLTAVCTVVGSRPAANITWVLGGEVITDGKINYFPSDTWVRQFEDQNNTQQLTLRLAAGTNGKDLWCEVEHIALSSPISSNKAKIVLRPSLEVCPPLVYTSLLITCIVDGSYKDCGLPQQTGTIASIQCKPGYKQPEFIFHEKATCLQGGNWSRPAITCTPECGKRNFPTGGAPLAAGARNSTVVGEFPWHIAVYIKSEGVFMQWCSGTLIRQNIVISAAHCFWDESFNRLDNTSEYKVAGGKLLRAWEDAAPTVQRRDVAAIHIPSLFSGLSIGRLASDLAVLRLATPFDISPVLNVACVDWNHELEPWQLREGQNGVVAGWGFTEAQVQSHSLKYVDLPYVSPPDCQASLPRDLKSLMTHDKFCAGFIDRTTGVCPGDSGGGLMFSLFNTNKYYLRGIVSIAFTPANNSRKCYAEHYTGFTKVSLFLHWLKDIV